MKVTADGVRVEFPGRTVGELIEYLGRSEQELVCVVDGYQCPSEAPLQGGEEVILIPRGQMPPPDRLERMLCARHTPGVYEKVKAARVGIAGLGGLGSSIALALARTGIGTLHLVDFDIVEPSNLNRQQYRISHLGMSKVQALKEEIAEINPAVTVLGDEVRLTADNAATIFSHDPIVCEALDGAETKAMLVNALLTDAKDTVVVSGSGMAGTDSANSVTTRRFGRRLYVCGDGQTQAERGRGLMAPRVMVCAGHQANMVLRLILGETEE